MYKGLNNKITNYAYKLNVLISNIYIPIVIPLYETMVRAALHFPMQNTVSWPGVYIR